MISSTEFEIKKLTDGLSAIRKIAGWSSEELGDLIGVTKQTISNIETRKSKMSKTQYIAIRAIIDSEIVDHPENELLPQIVELLLNGEDTPEDNRKAQATKKMIDSLTKTAITGGAVAGLSAFISALCGGVTVGSIAIPGAIIGGTAWIKEIKNNFESSEK